MQENAQEHKYTNLKTRIHSLIDGLRAVHTHTFGHKHTDTHSSGMHTCKHTHTNTVIFLVANITKNAPLINKLPQFLSQVNIPVSSLLLAD